MPTPRIPNGIKPLVRDYAIGAPDGVYATPIMGGAPRLAQRWSRGWQEFPVSILNNRTRQDVWSLFFHAVLRNGSVPFTMPLNSGRGGLQDHLCYMVPGSYHSEPASSGLHWLVSFTVRAQAKAYEVSAADAQDLIDLWNDLGETSPEVLRLLALAATGPASDWTRAP